MKEIRVSPKFVNTRNVRNGTAMIETMAVSAGEGRLAIIHSPAGLGKTRFAQWYASNNRCAFLRCQHNWRTSELEFLQAFCLELGIRTPPHRKGAAFMAVMDELNKQGGLPVFVEEIERLSKAFLELVRDFSDLSLAPFVLVGEEELVSHVKQVRRLWSRTCQLLEFQPLDLGDIIMYAREAAELNLSAEVAGIMYQESKGNFRVVKRDLQNLAAIMNAKGTPAPTPELVKVAIKQSLRG